MSRSGHFVRNQHSIVLGDLNEPEPDAAVVVGERRDFRDNSRANDVALLVKVCDSTLRDDRRRKLPLYAPAGIVEVWLLDLHARRLIVHTMPEGEEYGRVATFHEGESVSPTFRPEASVAVHDLLP